MTQSADRPRWDDVRAVPYFFEQALLPAPAGDAELARTRPSAAVSLAWLLREADRPRALALLDALHGRELSFEASARVTLLRSEWRAAEGDLAGAEELLRQRDIRTEFAQYPLLGFDYLVVASMVKRWQGQVDALSLSEEFLQWARRTRDADRETRAQVAMAFAGLTVQGAQAQETWMPVLKALVEREPPDPFAMATLGAWQYELGNPQQAVTLQTRAVELLEAQGQIVLACLAANNLVVSWADLQDLDASLRWAQRGLELAHLSGHAMSIGRSELRLAERLRDLSRLDEAQVHLSEAKRHLQPFMRSQAGLVLLGEAGRLALARGEPQQALRAFEQQLALAEGFKALGLVSTACLGAAQAQMRLGQLDAAEVWLHRCMALQGVRPNKRNHVLMTLARCKLLRGQNEEATRLMHEAVECKEGDGKVPHEWWAELSDGLAQGGHFEQAYQARVRADQAQREERAAEAQLRASSLALRAQEAQWQAETEVQRARATLLEASNQTLNQLGEVGQQLTSLLDEELIYQAINRHVSGLLMAEHFAVYRVDESGKRLSRAFAAQGSERFQPAWLELDNPRSMAARCFAEQRELQLELDPQDATVLWIPGSDPSRSALFAPLHAGERKLGVMTIQAAREGAFGDRERQVFRSLCAYASIALANAQAYQHLAFTQRHLAQQQRLAAVGAMVAGVAHEMNTPIGNALLAANTVADAGSGIQRAVAGGTLGKQQLLRFAADVEQAGGLVVSSLQRAAQLVQDFKQLVLDRRTLQRGVFALRPLVEELPQIFATRLREGQHRLDIEVPESLRLDAYREPLGDLLRHWADNALQHGLKHGGGRLAVQARPLPADRVELRLSDDGVGMSAEVLERAFEPFFSTQFSGRNSGLGMAVVHAVAVDLYGGELRLESALGQGTTLHWVFPLAAPQGAG